MRKRVFWNLQSQLHEDGYPQDVSPRKSRNTDGILSNENFSYSQKVPIDEPPEVTYPYPAQDLPVFFEIQSDIKMIADCTSYSVHCVSSSIA
jgi:hypothetical protein